MSPVIFVAVITVGLIIVLLLVGMPALKLTRDIEEAADTGEMAKRQPAVLQGEVSALETRLPSLDRETKQNFAWLRDAEEHLQWQEDELEQRSSLIHAMAPLLVRADVPPVPSRV